MSTDNNSVDRRSFIAAGAAGAAVVAAAPGALAKSTAAASLATGAELGAGWTVQTIHAAEAGAVRVVAAHSATTRVANVAICRSEAGSGALASTGAVDLFLMNDGGNGKRLTPDDEVQLVHRLAERLQGSEEILPGAAALMGRNERLDAFNPIDHLDPVAR